MRKPIIAGNWKMNTSVRDAIDLARRMVPELNGIAGVERVLCPPFISLVPLSEIVDGTAVRLGAQNMFWADSGAYTGEVSPVMLDTVCQYVILGHSERRQYFGETDETVNKKVKAALAHRLIPIVCVGENLQQNEAGQTAEVVTGQITNGLDSLTADEVKGIVIAYEPLWAIGTGKPATGTGANNVIALIRRTVQQHWGEEAAESVRIQYGGSVTAANIPEFISQPEIDGALVGGASLKPSEFVSIVAQSADLKGEQTGE